MHTILRLPTLLLLVNGLAACGCDARQSPPMSEPVRSAPAAAATNESPAAASSAQADTSPFEPLQLPAPAAAPATSAATDDPASLEAAWEARLVDALFVLAQDRRHTDLVRSFAWMLATHSDPSVRQGRGAMLAAKIIPEDKPRQRAQRLETMAAAHAELGEFDEAQRLAGTAAELYAAVSDMAAAATAQRRREGYLRGLPCREASAEAPADFPCRLPVPAACHWLRAVHLLMQQARAAGDPAAEAALLEFGLRLDPLNAQFRWQRGRAFLKAGQAPAAAADLQVAVARHPQHPDAWNDLGLALQELGRLPQVLDCYQRALRLQPRHTLARNNLAWLLATHPEPAQRDGRRALQLAQELVAELADEVSPAVLDTRAAAQAELGQFEAAIESIHRAEQLARQRGETAALPELQWRAALYRAGRPYREGMSIPGRAVNPADVHTASGRALLRQGQIDEAIAHFAQVYGGNLEHPGVLNDLGVVLLEHGQPAKAVVVWARALKLDPAAAQPLANLAWLLATCSDARLRSPHEAHVLAEVAVELAPTFSAWDTLAAAHAALNQFDAAVAAAARAANQARQQGLKASERAIAQRSALYQRRQAHVESAGQPCDDATCASAMLELGEVALLQGRGDDAVRWGRQAWQLRESPQAAFLLGRACDQRGDRNEAMEWYRRTLQHLPDHTAAANNLAWNLATADETNPQLLREALDLARRAAAVADDGDCRTLDTLAAVQAAGGQWDEAVATARRALDRARTTGAAGDALELVERLSHYQSGRRWVAAGPPSVPVHPAYRQMHYRLGVQHVGAGRLDAASRHLAIAARLRPDADVLTEQAEVLRQQGKVAQARALLAQALQLRPDWTPAMNNLAWLLATGTAAAPGDAQQAVRLAQRACEISGYCQAASLDTLAVAYAAAGDFDQAVQTARRALSVADPADPLTQAIRGRLRRFENLLPYYESPRQAEP